MPAIRKLPPTHILRQLRLQGKTLKEIGDAYQVTESSVWRAMDRANMLETRRTVSDILPWDVAAHHKTTAVMERFRTISKQQNGLDTSPVEERLLEAWLQGLADNDLVVNYHPDAPPNDASSKGGFYYVPRQPRDKWIVRAPVT